MDAAPNRDPLPLAIEMPCWGFSMLSVVLWKTDGFQDKWRSHTFKAEDSLVRSSSATKVEAEDICHLLKDKVNLRKVKTKQKICFLLALLNDTFLYFNIMNSLNSIQWESQGLPESPSLHKLKQRVWGHSILRSQLTQSLEAPEKSKTNSPHPNSPGAMTAPHFECPLVPEKNCTHAGTD